MNTNTPVDKQLKFWQNIDEVQDKYGIIIGPGSLVCYVEHNLPYVGIVKEYNPKAKRQKIRITPINGGHLVARAPRELLSLPCTPKIYLDAYEELKS